MASSFPMKKNTATKIVFPILDADGDLVSSAAGLDSEYSLDGGSFSDCTNEATEIGSTGIYYLSLLAGETNGDVFCIQVKTTTSGAKTTVLVFYTAAQTLDETDVVVDAIKAKTDNLPADPADDSDIDAQLATIDTVVDGIKAVTDNLPDSGALTTIQADLDNPSQYKATGFSTHAAADVWTVGTRALTDKAGFSLSAAGVDAIVDDVIEGSLTVRQAIRIMVSALVNKSTGGGTTTLTSRDLADSKARVTLTVDANGNRTASTLDGT